MSDRTLDRIGAACGVLWLALEFVSFPLVAATHAVPGSLASEQEIARILAAPPPTQAWVGEYLSAAAVLLFLIFTTRLWALLWRAEGGRGWLSVTVLGAGLVYVALKVPQHAALHVLWTRAGHGLGIQAGAALWDSYQDLLFASVNFDAVMAAATAVVVLRTLALPRWLGWSAIACAVALLVGSATHSFGLVLPFGFWVALTAVVLFLRTDAAPARERAATSSAAAGT